MSDKEDLKCASFYRDITYKKLSELIQIEAEKGKSSLDLNFYTSESMKNYLIEKGYKVSISTGSYAYTYIYW